MSINSIAADPEFQKTGLYKEFHQKPFGFVDVGSLEGVHSFVDPIASIISAACFEPNSEDCRKVQACGNGPYRSLQVFPIALSDKKGKKKIHLTRKPTNCSFLKPSEHFIQRYSAIQFELKGTDSVTCDTLDQVLKSQRGTSADFIKLDTQGSEYEILKGARKALEGNCVGILCEVEFMEIYEKQKTFTDVDALLRDYGFCLYGFTPHYRSTKSLDPRSHKTQERLLWADAFFLKDPLDSRNLKTKFSTRQLMSVVMSALLASYFDAAYEITKKKLNGDPALLRYIENQAKVNNAKAAQDVSSLFEQCRKNPEAAALLLAQFVSRHRMNSDLDYLSNGA